MRESYIKEGTKILAKEIANYHEFTIDDFLEICIDSDIGMDIRTAKSWLRVMKKKGIVAQKRTQGISNKVIFIKGPKIANYILSSSQENEKKLSGGDGL